MRMDDRHDAFGEARADVGGEEPLFHGVFEIRNYL